LEEKEAKGEEEVVQIHHTRVGGVEVDGGAEPMARGGGLSMQPRTPTASQGRQRVRVEKEAGVDNLDLAWDDGAGR
jgi:hypothetical protein